MSELENRYPSDTAMTATAAHEVHLAAGHVGCGGHQLEILLIQRHLPVGSSDLRPRGCQPWGHDVRR